MCYDSSGFLPFSVLLRLPMLFLTRRAVSLASLLSCQHCWMIRLNARWVCVCVWVCVGGVRHVQASMGVCVCTCIVTGCTFTCMCVCMHMHVLKLGCGSTKTAAPTLHTQVGRSTSTLECTSKLPHLISKHACSV